MSKSNNLKTAATAGSADSAALTSQMELNFLFVYYAFQTSDCLFLQAKTRHLY
jgi:hypothetical protein